MLLPDDEVMIHVVKGGWIVYAGNDRWVYTNPDSLVVGILDLIDGPNPHIEERVRAFNAKQDEGED